LEFGYLRNDGGGFPRMPIKEDDHRPPPARRLIGGDRLTVAREKDYTATSALSATAGN
jgi:hypothetical protein